MRSSSWALTEKIELNPRRLEMRSAVRRADPGRAAGDRPTVVAGNLQVAMAKFIERLPPAAIAAIERQRPDPLGMPSLSGMIRRHRKLVTDLDRTLVGGKDRVVQGTDHGCGAVRGRNIGRRGLASPVQRKQSRTLADALMVVRPRVTTLEYPAGGRPAAKPSRDEFRSSFRFFEGIARHKLYSQVIDGYGFCGRRAGNEISLNIRENKRNTTP